MGVDLNLYLPGDVGPAEVAAAMSILLGAKPRKYALGRSEKIGNRWVEYAPRLGESFGISFAKTETIGYKPNSAVEGYVDFVIPKAIQERVPSWFMPGFNYASRRGRGIYNRVHMRSTASKVALAIRLAQFFGGLVEPGDHESKVIRFKRTCPTDRQGMIPQDGSSWNRYHEALFNLRPLSVKDVEKATPLAAYGEEAPFKGATR